MRTFVAKNPARVDPALGSHPSVDLAAVQEPEHATDPSIPRLPIPTTGGGDAATGVVPLSAVLSMISANERQSVQTVFQSQALHTAQAMADTQRMLAMYLARR